ncbi:TetR/AcrR family transcriptional regulator [Sphingomonas sp. CGMCC 1.13654]|uniref:TetR/AcrR family transcriptional regulator n=1 Tax=Sphingomonas chungangi TaxID=2683589 RepID=A0A838L844_9SPHN|nr:TetR/AcrR family transcriptional regulator [Sphingomonas chungangi]MBA2934306.1 TetR/AcrR family transcriptional regulator [Sphingomonas chungangi]
MTETETAPMGRRETRKAERRAAIIELATRTFLENGYDRTTMSGIAAGLGGSKGTLWSYFGSKEDLFAAVLDSATAAFRSVMSAVLDPRLPIDRVLTSFAGKFLTRITMPDAIALQRLIISEVERFPEIGRIFYDRAPGRSRELLAHYLAGQMEIGALRKDDPDEAAGLLLGLCAGGYPQRLLWGIEKREDDTIRREAARIVGQFLRCYGVTGAVDG